MIRPSPLRDYAIRRSGPVDAGTLERVRKIVEDVRTGGDAAVRRFTKRFDKVDLPSAEVPAEDLVRAERALPQQSQRAIRSMYESVVRYHKQTLPKPFEMQPVRGVTLGRQVVPFDLAGLYVPGGRAAYPSSLIMGAAPAAVAGVRRLALCTPPAEDGGVPPAVLYAAKVAGIERVFRIGGAQAIAAMAFGTETVPRVEIVAGPGNAFVTAAKKLVSDRVAIDFLAGPTELLIVSDGNASPRFVAADLLAQAEHDPAACAIFVTTSERQAEAVCAELETRIGPLERADVVRRAIGSNGAVLIADSIEEAMAFANEVGPEHLVLAVRQPVPLLQKVRHAGSVFLGEHSAVAIGDYGAGPNAILPTGGEARRVSGLSAASFVKSIPYQLLSREGVESVAPMAIALARMEGLGAHQKSIEVRLGR